MNELVTPPPKNPRVRSAKRRLPFAPSFIIGLLLVPASAVAANLLITSTPVESAVERYQPFQEHYWVDLNAQNAAAEELAAPTATPPVTDEDLALACGPEGLALVDKEAAEAISDLERAALAALRPICEEAGMPLPGQPEPPPIIQTVTVVQASAGGASTPPVAVSASAEHEEDERDDGEHDEDDHERDEDDERDD